MISASANPACAASLEYSKGQFYRSHCETTGATPRNSHLVRHFWVWEQCSRIYMLECRNGAGVFLGTFELVSPQCTCSFLFQGSVLMDHDALRKVGVAQPRGVCTFSRAHFAGRDSERNSLNALLEDTSSSGLTRVARSCSAEPRITWCTSPYHEVRRSSRVNIVLRRLEWIAKWAARVLAKSAGEVLRSCVVIATVPKRGCPEPLISQPRSGLFQSEL